MKTATRWGLLFGGALVALGAYAVALHLVPPVAANGLLRPYRRAATQRTPASCTDAVFDGVGVKLKAWRCGASGAPRATLVFLHGVADNRGSAAGLVHRFVSRQFDVLAYDSRAQGESTGDVCTYGYWEKRDLEKVLDTVRPGPVVLLGTSLGAAVALQAAAEDRRVTAVVGAEVFSDLRTVARDRAPRFLPEGMITRAFVLAEDLGSFRLDAVSPLEAARRIRVPVLLIHGDADSDTRPEHAQRVFRALKGPKELMLVKGAHHNESLRDERTWLRIETWLDEVLHHSIALE